MIVAVLIALVARMALQADPIQEVELALQVRVPEKMIEFGRPFELTVVQTSAKTLEVEEWGTEKLAPLTATLIERRVRDNDTHVEETRRFACFAFEVDEIVLPGLFLRARSREDGAQRVALSDELGLEVVSSLEDDDDGAMELPREPFPAPLPWALWVVLVSALAGVSFVGQRAYRRRRSVEPEVPPEPPHAVAVRRIGALRSSEPATREEVRAYHVEISALLRAYLEGRFEVASSGKTTDEFFSDSATTDALAPEVHARLRALLEQSDLVKYAGQASGPEERGALLDTIEAFVEETRAVADVEKVPSR